MKKYRIEITTQDRWLSVQEADGTSHPQVYHKIQYKNDLDKALDWARNYIKELRRLGTVTYLKTEIKEFEFVRDIPVDF